MTHEEFCVRVNSEAVLGSRSWSSAKTLTDAVMSILATFPDSEIESHDGPDPDDLKDIPPPTKQRDLFEPPDDYDQNWEDYLEKLNNPKQ